MDTKQKNLLAIISVLILAIVAVIAFIDLYTPAPMGRQGVIREIVHSFIVFIIACCFIFGLVYVIRRKLIKTLPGILILIAVIIAGLLGIRSVSKGIMALNSDPITIENGNYKLEYRSSYTGPGSYYISVVNGYNTTHIRIDKSSYDYLSSNTPNITISYYPYVNIAAEIIYQPATP